MVAVRHIIIHTTVQLIRMAVIRHIIIHIIARLIRMAVVLHTITHTTARLIRMEAALHITIRIIVRHIAVATVVNKKYHLRCIFGQFATDIFLLIGEIYYAQYNVDRCMQP